MAMVLGVVETIMSVLPVFGIYGSITMNVICMGLASMFVKDFHIDWSGGYRTLALGVGVINGIRMILSLLLYIAIAAILS